MTLLWLRDPADPPSSNTARRKIRGGPLINLAGLQAAIRNGALGDDDVWLATRKCENDLQNLAWSMRDLLECIQSLQPMRSAGGHDFKEAEWCRSSGGQWVACDVYVIRYDEQQRCRSRHGLEIYLKFSVTENGALTLVMLSAHV